MQYGTNVNVRLPQATLDAIDKEAELQSRTRSNLIRKILHEWIVNMLATAYRDAPATYQTEMEA